MIFDGMKFRRTTTVVAMPYELYEGNDNNYTRFGRVIPHGKKPGRKAINITKAQSCSRWSDGSDLYAVEIPSDGWSLTNMMYCRDEVRNGEVFGRAYLLHRGEVYTSRWYRGTVEEIQSKKENENA